MGYPYIYPKGTEDKEIYTSLLTKEDLDKNADAVKKLTTFISDLSLKRLSDSKAVMCGIQKDMVKPYISVDSDGCSVLDYSNLLSFLNGIHISSGENVIEYQTGRKDFIL